MRSEKSARRPDRGIHKESGPDGCWPWKGSVTSAGYGTMRIGARVHLVHRVVWTFHNDTIPDGIQINHRCCSDSNCHGGVGCAHRKCCNPEHLELTTGRFNSELSARNRGLAQLLHCGHPRSPQNARAVRDGLICQACEAA